MDTRGTAITVVCLILLLSNPSFAAPKICGQRLVHIVTKICTPSSGGEPCFDTTNKDLPGLRKSCCLNGCTLKDIAEYCCSE
uniref:Insulin-like domain-containing protein n=1 Tax=Plectus sambesii TaxID=2011161 RepID=A0A914UZP6_9BILA